ncbi:hypothetical protein DERP_014945 [Dermatophagoides pteronyssinus]|uniref:Uncharacterized protein n=1 Tax=Dermatophagoides pteronyssinus TaxID=6956 RepID=A0ABQ8JWP3_DERPT|nr:hypothetical protein DERP_014945 [Dermatophagoides pteronyssinus]
MSKQTIVLWLCFDINWKRHRVKSNETKRKSHISEKYFFSGEKKLKPNEMNDVTYKIVDYCEQNLFQIYIHSHNTLVALS